MSNNKKVLDFYKEQRRFGYIEAVTIYKDIENGNMLNNLKISLFNYPHTKGDEKLLLSFQNVGNLRIKELDGLYKTVFSITDVSSDQIEDTKFEIVEEENNLICFGCKEFEFFVV